MHTFPAGWVNRLSIPTPGIPASSTTPPLAIYLMANWGMGTRRDGDVVRQAELPGLLDRAAALGPVDAGARRDSRGCPADDPGARAYQPQISPKWIAGDGTLVLARVDRLPGDRRASGPTTRSTRRRSKCGSREMTRRSGRGHQLRLAVTSS